MIGRWFLGEVDAQRYITRSLWSRKEIACQRLRRVWRKLIEPSERAAELVVAAWLGADTSWDTAALAAILVAPLVNLRRAKWTYARPPLGVDDETLLQTWADVCEHFSKTAPRGGRKR